MALFSSLVCRSTCLLRHPTSQARRVPSQFGLWTNRRTSLPRITAVGYSNHPTTQYRLLRQCSTTISIRRQHRHWLSSKHCYPRYFTTKLATRSDPGSHHEQSPLTNRFQQFWNETILPSILHLTNEFVSFPDNNDGSSTKLVLLLGVSGGCDSVALLHLLKELRDTSQSAIVDRRVDNDKHRHPGSTNIYFDLHVVTFDHQQRPESEKDCQFVQDLCKHYNLPCDTYVWNQDHSDNHSSSSSTNISFTQESARTWRRSRMKGLLHDLVETRRQKKGEIVLGALVTAHHLDDSNETLLLKLLRGAHITNLQGMEAILLEFDDQHNTDGTTDLTKATLWLRPLLTVKKSDIISYLRDHNFTWREDSSNRSNKYQRNRIRNELLPLLTDIAGGDDILQKRLDHLQAQSKEIDQDLTVRATEYFEETQGGDYADKDTFHLPLPGKTQQLFPFLSEPSFKLLRQQALYQWILSQQTKQSQKWKLDKPAWLSYEQLQRIGTQLDQYPHNRQWRLNLGNQWDLVRSGDILRLDYQSKHDTENEPDFERHVLQWSILSMSPGQEDSTSASFKLHNLDSNALASLTIVRTVGRAMGRHPQHNNDVPLVTFPFCPPWRTNPVSVKEFLRGQKVPLHERDTAPLIIVDYGMTNHSQVAAVWVATKDRWLVHADFDKKNQGEGTSIAIQL